MKWEEWEEGEEGEEEEEEETDSIVIVFCTERGKKTGVARGGKGLRVFFLPLAHTHPYLIIVEVERNR